MIKMLFEYLFAPRDAELYPPCGMFTLPHIIALFVMIFLIAIALWFSHNISNKNIKKLCKIFAIVFTILEGIKIGYNLINGYNWLDAWFPLAYCSIFIYSLYFSGFGKGIVEKCGLTFLCGGGIIAGSFFLIFPTTSLMLHPIYHYLCIYSMVFHSAMVYMAIIILTKKHYEMKLKDSQYYIAYVFIFSIIAISINTIFDCNMMFYKAPFNMPIEFVVAVYNISPILYTLLIFIAYSSLYFITFYSRLLIKRLRERKNEIN